MKFFYVKLTQKKLMVFRNETVMSLKQFSVHGLTFYHPHLICYHIDGNYKHWWEIMLSNNVLKEMTRH